MGELDGELVARAGMLYADDQLEEARATLEQAFTALRQAGDLRGAAMAAARLGEIHAGSLGNEALGRGWMSRARRLLEEVGPCVEWGYWELARLACDRPDIDELEASAARALEIARQFGDVGLEGRALADSGLALVTRGRVNEGFSRFDEALATLSTGEVRDVYLVGTALCSLLSSCDRAGDVQRAVESIRLVEDLLLQPLEGRPKVLGTHCRLAFGSVLCAVGRWSDGEAALLEALGPDASKSLGHRVEALARLAELRVHQGRVDEAAQLLATIEDSIPAAGPLALVHLNRGDPELAGAVLRKAIRRMVGDVLRAGPLTALLVEAEIAHGDLAAAREAASLLHSMAKAVDTALIAALADAADGGIALASNDAEGAVRRFEVSLDRLPANQYPLLAAELHLRMAEAFSRAGDTSSAVASARSAHAGAQRLQATALQDKAAATLRALGAPPPRPAPRAEAVAGLTARETSVLAGIQRGESNAQIAASLYISPKTVEHHVSRLLGKLGVRTRAEAAAVAARMGA